MFSIPAAAILSAEYGPTSKLATTIGSPDFFASSVSASALMADSLAVSGRLPVFTPPPMDPAEPPSPLGVELGKAVTSASEAIDADYAEVQARFLFANAYDGIRDAGTPVEAPTVLSGVTDMQRAIDVAVVALTALTAKPINDTFEKENDRFQQGVAVIDTLKADIARLSTKAADDHARRSKALYTHGLKMAMVEFK